MANPNMTDEEIIKHIKENKDVLPAGLNINDIKKLRGKGEVNNVSAQHIDEGKSSNNTNIKDTINNSSLKQNNNSYNNENNNENPIFKIKTMMDNKMNQKNNAYDFTKEQKNNETGGQNKNGQNNNDNYEININDLNFTFGNTNGGEQNVLDNKSLQSKKVSCEMVRNCLSSIKECFGKNT